MVDIICVCQKCGHHQHDSVIEFHFGDQKVTWLCPECKKENNMTMLKLIPPLPKISARGRSRARKAKLREE